jgi:hypothetical protein
VGTQPVAIAAALREQRQCRPCFTRAAAES